MEAYLFPKMLGTRSPNSSVIISQCTPSNAINTPYPLTPHFFQMCEAEDV